MGGDVDLELYFSRIDYRGRRDVTLETLHALTRAHAQAIPFENLDVLLRQPIALEPEAVFDKLVVQQRGGYCFEQNGLFMRVLQQLGFQARPLGARVRLRTPDRNDMPARTHLLLAVELDGRQWLTDVGFGGFSLTAALLWQAGLEQRTPHDRRRLVCEDDRWFHQVWQEGGWLDVYELDGLPMFTADQQVANWYTSGHPDSTFMRQLMVARANADGSRSGILGNQLRLRGADGETRIRTLDSNELPELLWQDFGLRWPEGVDPARLEDAGALTAP